MDPLMGPSSSPLREPLRGLRALVVAGALFSLCWPPLSCGAIVLRFTHQWEGVAAKSKEGRGRSEATQRRLKSSESGTRHALIVP